jgi:predicted GH43/DUF377 family glycosyl hydrolase
VTDPLVRRTDHVLRPDPRRVVTQLFLPGQERLTVGASRASTVLDRVLALTDDEVDRALEQTLRAFGTRHRDLAGTFERRFLKIAHRLADPRALSRRRRLLAGAYFSQEYALESAALFNPSMVAHPDQSGLPDGATRFVMSVRSVGEGHISSIGFRTGVVDSHSGVRFDEPGRPLAQAESVPVRYSRAQFVRQLGLRAEDDNAAGAFVLAGLPESFDRPSLDRAVATLRSQSLTRGSASVAIERLEAIAASHYCLEFPARSAIDERVILPTAPGESHGLEDLRLVRFTKVDGSVSYRGTYTAYDGVSVAPAMLQTDDFRTFGHQLLSGSAAQDKGMALFPREVGGRQLALSRWDRESTSLAESSDGSHWEVRTRLQQPARPWEIVQVGNCGPPLETPVGWLVLTHGVGPVRQYGIGAMLLDLSDPSIVLGSLAEPLLTANDDERDGYVPNVVYSCGAMVHGGTLVLPYGCSDSVIRVAVVDLDRLLAGLAAG